MLYPNITVSDLWYIVFEGKFSIELHSNWMYVIVMSPKAWLYWLYRKQWLFHNNKCSEFVILLNYDYQQNYFNLIDIPETLHAG